ncbi:MAG: dihydrolipoyl dehydrogenase family protein, partial [Oscillospiraceae bacterium]
MQLFDLIVLGGGPAGYLAGERAGQAGLSAAVVEKRALGGVCLNEGCIPSKSLLYCAKAYEYAAHGNQYGVSADNVSIDQGFVIKRKNKVVKKLVAGVGAKLKHVGVTVLKGEGVITGRTAEGFSVAVDGETYNARKLLIATGSSTAVPPIPGVKEGLESGLVLTNREILDLTEIPKELVVIGGGVIGLEMASYYNSVGSKVTVVEMLSQIGGPIDGEIAEILQKNYEKKGVTFLLNAKVTAVGPTGVTGVKGVTYEADGAAHTVPADKILLSVGRRPNTQGIGLEALGVYTERGAVVTDDRMRTNVSGVYAAGDVNGRSMLAHTAYREAEVAISHMAGKKDVMRYGAIPAVIYTTPEVACVGETEATAKAKGLDIVVAKLPMSYSGRYLAET